MAEKGRLLTPSEGVKKKRLSGGGAGRRHSSSRIRSDCQEVVRTALQQLADDGVADEEAGGGNGQAAVAEDEGAGGKKAVDRGPQRTWKLRKSGMARVFCGSGTIIRN